MDQDYQIDYHDHDYEIDYDYCHYYEIDYDHDYEVGDDYENQGGGDMGTCSSNEINRKFCKIAKFCCYCCYYVPHLKLDCVGCAFNSLLFAATNKKEGRLHLHLKPFV